MKLLRKHNSNSLEERLAISAIFSARVHRQLAKILIGILIAFFIALIFTPWQQTVRGTGRITAYDPDERPQLIEAPIDGRIIKWHITEGMKVNAGTPIVDLADNDPHILERLNVEKEQTQRTVEAADQRIASIESRISMLMNLKSSSIDSARLREQMSHDRVSAAQQALNASKAAQLASQQNYDRQQALKNKGLASVRSVELAQMEIATRQTEVDRAQASLSAARKEASSFNAELLKTEADAESKIEEARASLASAQSDAAKARAELTKIESRVQRQTNQHVLAPSDGTVLRVIGRRGGEMLKAGEALATLVPDSSHNVVEIWVDGNDMPLILPGQPARLQFEGWPALQFSGWPSIAVGTFGGRVLSIDGTDNGAGQFRVLIEPDSNDEPWPSKQFLRQGVRANGWIMLNTVPLGYELWRQFNGFPPAISHAEPDVIHSYNLQPGAPKPSPSKSSSSYGSSSGETK